jgi:hypothetical protein
MSRMLNLYPRAWQERYRAEMEDLLIAHPPTSADRLDLLRGALDAWLNPQIRHVDAPAEGQPGESGVGAGAAILGGVMFAAGGLGLATSRVGPDGYKESGSAVAIVVLGMLLTAIAALLAATDRRSLLTSTAMAGGALGTFLPWPLLAVGSYVYILAAIGLGILLLARGRLVGLAILAVGVLLPAFNTESEWALAAVPVGVLWMTFGLAVWRPGLTVAPGWRANRS